MSLDAFAIAGNPFLLSWCVLGRLCRSWEHRRLPPPFLVHNALTFKRGLCNRFSMRFGFHRFLSPSFGSPLFSSWFPFTHLLFLLFPESVCEGFFVKNICRRTTSHLHLHLCTSTAHLHIYIHNCTSTSLLIFTSSHLHLTSLPLIYISHLHLSLFLTFSLKAGGSTAGAPRNATLCRDRARRAHEMQARVRFVPVRRNPLRRSRASSARNAGESAICPGPSPPSAEIVRVECAKCRRECDLSRSCPSSARNAGESAICPGRGQPSAEIARVERAKCRRECDLSRSVATQYQGTGDFVVQL